jgi:secreted Zn-dependent insulinase-like peptidase
MNQVFVVAFNPYQDRASIGGFNYYFSREQADLNFNLQCYNNSTHLVKLLECQTNYQDRALIASDIDRRLDDGENFPVIKEYCPI